MSGDHSGWNNICPAAWARLRQAWQDMGSGGSNWPAYSLVAAMALALVVVFPRGDNFPTLDELWYDWPYAPLDTGAARSNNFSYALKVSLQAGLRSGLTDRVGDRDAWLPVINAFPEVPPTCTGDTNPGACDARQTLAAEIGIHAAENYLLCAALDQEQISAAHPVWAEQRVDWTRLNRKLLALNDPALSVPLRGLIAQLASADENGATCNLVGDLIFLSY